MRSDVEMHDYSAIMTEYDEAEQYSERRCRNGEEINGDDIGDMIIEEGSPGLRRRLAMADLVLVHSCLRDLVAEEPECFFRWRRTYCVACRVVAKTVYFVVAFFAFQLTTAAQF